MTMVSNDNVERLKVGWGGMQQPLSTAGLGLVGGVPTEEDNEVEDEEVVLRSCPLDGDPMA
jgi:hypothetical protein